MGYCEEHFKKTVMQAVACFQCQAFVGNITLITISIYCHLEYGSLQDP